MNARAAVVKRLGDVDFTLDEIEVLPPGPRDVIVRTTAAAYCITDNINRDGLLGKQDNTVLGHSAVGVVEAVGSQVTTVKEGDRVNCGGSPECGECHNCARGRPDQCVRLFEFALPLGRSLLDGSDVLLTPVGGYAEIMRLPDVWPFPVETKLADEIVCMLGCGVTSGLGAVFNVAAVEPGSSVAILGCGQLGLWMVQAARVAGAAEIFAIEPLAERRALAMRLGATATIDPGAGDPVEQVRDLTRGRGADYTLEAVGSVDSMRQAIDMTLNTGVVVLTGVETAKAQVTISALEIAIRGRDIRNSQNGRCRYRRDLPRYIELIEDGHIDAEAILAGRYPLDAINEVAGKTGRREVLTAALMPGLESGAG